MKFQLRDQMLSKPNQPKILHDDRVSSGRSDGFQLSGSLSEFICENKGIKGDVPSHIPIVQVLHHRREFLQREVMSTQPGIELRQPEINRVRAVSYSSTKTLPVTRWAQ